MSVKEDLGPCTMLVEELRFSQAGVLDRFRNGQRILSVMQGLRDNKIRVESLPSIKVFPKDGQWFSADNRRLWCFKEAGLKQVPVRKIPPSKQYMKKMRNENEGARVVVRPSTLSYIDPKGEIAGTRCVQTEEQSPSTTKRAPLDDVPVDPAMLRNASFSNDEGHAVI